MFKTVLKQSSGEVTEKRSRFVSVLYPAESECAARGIIRAHRAKYRGARHNAYACSIGDGYAKYSDDGEPRDTAGRPIFDVIKFAGITDCVIVISRYFGGVLLGTGGLARAYGESARRAVAKAEIVTMCKSARYSARVPYPVFENFTNWLYSHGASVLDKTFADYVTVAFSVPQDICEAFMRALETSPYSGVKAEFSGWSVLPCRK